MGTKIKDAQLLESVTGAERIPVSDGSGNPKAVTTETLKNFVGAGSSGGGGITIVDSEDKLETLDLPQGSLASVASVAKSSSFRNFYQPPADMMEDMFNIEKYLPLCSSVNSIEFSFPTGLWEGIDCGMMLAPRGFSFPSNAKMIAIMFQVSNGYISSIAARGMDTGFSMIQICSYDDNGVPSIVQESIDAINSELETDEWCYMGETSVVVASEEHLQIFDKFLTPISGVNKSETFIKSIERWDKLAKQQEGYPVVKTTYNEGGISIQPNTYYKIDMTSSPLNISFSEPINKNLTNEYVVEIKCSGQSVSFPENLKWVSGNTPVFNDGEIIVVSIVNNLALFAQFYE